MGDSTPRVFISYCHESAEHRRRVLSLSTRLRSDGVDSNIDQYVKGSPENGWARWAQDQVRLAEFVLVVCTKSYYVRFLGQEVGDEGKGGDWEGAIITQKLYDDKSIGNK